MEWKKYIVSDKYLESTGMLAAFLLLISFYFHSRLLSFLAIVLLVLIYVNSLYLKHVGKRLYFINEKEKTKFFPNDNGVWVFQFENNGLPIMNGKLTVAFDDIVAPMDGMGDHNFSKYEVTIPFSINHKQKNRIVLPFTALKRGAAKVWSLQIHIPHFFGLGETVLEYRHFLMQEVVVYPLPRPVKNLNSLMSEKSGNSVVAHSLIEDPFSPAGTRDYVYSDSFNRINWKASARMQVLQTKVFERVAETGWTLSLNIANGHSVFTHLEELLSSAAEVAYFSMKHNIPLTLCINVGKAGAIPFYYLPTGTGKEQLQKVLEMLAMVKAYSYTIPYEKMLSYYNRHLIAQPYFIHGGNRTSRETNSFQQLQQNGIKLFELQVTENETSLENMRMIREVVVND